MFAGLRILAVVPARGGSKGLPRKNLRLMNGVPLVALAGQTIQKVAAIDRAVVSTDDPEIADAAKQVGLHFNGSRPEALSGDRVPDQPVLLHELQVAERADGTKYDIVVMLQPTSPLRKHEHVQQTIEMLVEGSFDAVWTVSRTDLKFHPLKQLRVIHGRLEYYLKEGGQIVARQQLDQVYHRNGVAYAIRRQCLVEQQSIKGSRTGALVIDDELVNIDSAEDLARADSLLSSRSARPAEPENRHE